MSTPETGSQASPEYGLVDTCYSIRVRGLARWSPRREAIHERDHRGVRRTD